MGYLRHPPLLFWAACTLMLGGLLTMSATIGTYAETPAAAAAADPQLHDIHAARTHAPTLLHAAATGDLAQAHHIGQQLQRIAGQVNDDPHTTEPVAVAFQQLHDAATSLAETTDSSLQRDAGQVLSVLRQLPAAAHAGTPPQPAADSGRLPVDLDLPIPTPADPPVPPMPQRPNLLDERGTLQPPPSAQDQPRPELPQLNRPGPDSTTDSSSETPSSETPYGHTTSDTNPDSTTDTNDHSDEEDLQ